MCRYFVAGLKMLALACIVAGSGVAADSGDDATNNLFSDLAPSSPLLKTLITNIDSKY
ncbi:hypothetical protein BDD12DRAFT_829967 [Trichophaea hybrida]|nr:hypothetical protein BDD12DRAFT_829967 [Trichophaea hybrida]